MSIKIRGAFGCSGEIIITFFLLGASLIEPKLFWPKSYHPAWASSMLCEFILSQHFEFYNYLIFGGSSIPQSHLSLLPGDKNIISLIHKMHLRDIGNVWKWKMHPQSNLVQFLKDVLLSVSHIEMCTSTKIRLSSEAMHGKSVITFVHFN